MVKIIDENLIPKLLTNNLIRYESFRGGGSIFCYYSSSTITRNTITHNYGTNGGGINCYVASPTITNNIIAGNSAAGDGGGIWCHCCAPIITNNTISGNSAQQRGGILSSSNISYPSPIVTNCILWADTPEEIFAYPADLPPEVTYTDVQGGYSGTGNIDADPNFASPSNDDYHLKSQEGRWDPNTQSWVYYPNTSPCIDAGDPNSDWTGELWPHGKRINMGAYGGMAEASMSLSDIGNIADLNNDDEVESQDLRLFGNDWLRDEVLLKSDLDRNGRVDLRDFGIVAFNWLWAEQ